MTTPISDMHEGHTVRGRYDTQPTVALPAGERILRGSEGWSAVAELAGSRAAGAPIVLVDTYPGADVAAVTAAVREALPEWNLIDVETAARPVDEIERLIAPNLTDDRVFGVMSHFVLSDFYDSDALARLAGRIVGTPAVVIGWGAALLAPLLDRPAVTVLADMARWEIQLRQRAGAPNWRADNAGEDNLRKYKRGFFVEWRVADRHKRTLFDTLDFVLDGNAIAP
ncbi:MAG: mannose-6-phosphate isomerase, partial [Microbacterium sp.]|nr:mannose-6-phosphate isomerase [Microbacterium sp.]